MPRRLMTGAQAGEDMEAFGKGQGSLAQVEGSNPALLRLGAGIGLPLAGHCRRDHDKANGHQDQEAELRAHLQFASFLSHLAAAGAAGASSNTPFGWYAGPNLNFRPSDTAWLLTSMDGGNRSSSYLV
jgi:hypothetical protein